jgi:hypothetical protein
MYESNPSMASALSLPVQMDKYGCRKLRTVG